LPLLKFQPSYKHEKCKRPEISCDQRQWKLVGNSGQALRRNLEGASGRGLGGRVAMPLRYFLYACEWFIFGYWVEKGQIKIINNL